MKKHSRGFSLIELLIVVAIILIIAAIAIPYLLRSRVAANQASAVGSIRTINTAEITYASTYTSGYSSALGYLGPPAGTASPTSLAAGLIDSVLAGTAGGTTTGNTSAKSGYSFTYGAAAAVAGRIDAYTITGNPTQGCGTGNGNCYFTDNSGVLRQNSTAAATAADSPVGG